MQKSVFMHIDVNSAYLSWEAAWRLQHGEKIDLRKIPSVVGGSQATRHGIVLAKSTPAKKLFNIKTGEPIAAVRRRAPNIVVVPPRFEIYLEASRAFIALLHDFSPEVDQFSVDEAFLDYTGMQNIFGEPVEAAYKISERIKTELGFTVNIGVSTNKLLAKMASEMEKPDKVHTLFPDEIERKMWPMPIGELYMVGKKMADKFNQRGVFTIGDLAKLDVSLPRIWFKSWGEQLWHFANGRYIDTQKRGAGNFQGTSSGHEEDIGAKSVGNSGTIAFDVADRETAHKALLSISETVGMRLRKLGRSGHVVTASYTTFDLQRFCRRKKYPMPTSSTMEIYERAAEVFDSLWDGTPIRQFGISVGDLADGGCRQMAIDQDFRKEALEHAIDNIRGRYGDMSIFRASFMDCGFSHMIGGTMGGVGAARNFLKSPVME